MVLKRTLLTTLCDLEPSVVGSVLEIQGLRGRKGRSLTCSPPIFIIVQILLDKDRNTPELTDFSHHTTYEG